MFNRNNNNNKRNELRSALRSGDPYAVAKVFQISGVAPQKAPSEPQLGGNNKEPLQENGVDFTNVAKLLVEANEYAVHVRRFRLQEAIIFPFFVFLSLTPRLANSHSRHNHQTLSPCHYFFPCLSLSCRVMPSRVMSHKLPCMQPFIKPLDHRRGIGWYRPCTRFVKRRIG